MCEFLKYSAGHPAVHQDRAGRHSERDAVGPRDRRPGTILITCSSRWLARSSRLLTDAYHGQTSVSNGGAVNVKSNSPANVAGKHDTWFCNCRVTACHAHDTSRLS